MTRIFLFLLSISFSISFSQKMNGISVNGEKFKPNFNNFSYLTKSNANWVSVQAFCFVKSPTSGVDFDRKKFWYSQTLEGIKTYIKTAKKNRFKVFLKPHTITEYGKVWSGNFNYATEQDWKVLETTYKTYILTLAKIAQDHQVEAMSIGVEVQNFFTKRKQFVSQLIQDVRKVFKGKITYCANWDEFDSISFWKELDFIGIDSYFTISQEVTPTVSQCIKNLNPIKKQLSSLSRKVNKKIVFTEFGFQSRNYAGHNPWNWEGNKRTIVNMKGQANAYQAVFDTFWKENWFLGGFSWKWHLDYAKSGGYFDNTFTPQNKPAESVISRVYSLYKTVP